ncbi:MAG TPA: KpsF/GutQ family sugar-phosphate isomerase [Candidatus Desulfofervidus auxilii]|uniref:KpsF/GutQ family sugar-phosphate isomerase n=1 Tax=Desulfofervidus auxilii TaxID=1621989 RepID=A0A7V0IAD0_DESA2|nr:KpsF/GutQ family sugar-phosphate isomerase [Candidatus Desulfofervidus auxilii]
MKNREIKSVIKRAREVLEIEVEGILGVIDKLGEEFAKAIDVILKAEGRVIVTGIGKSGIIGRKIVATLNSTGTPALFLHPVEAMHGDLGMVTKKDVILAISNSGETGEITILIPSLKRLGAPLIAFTGNPYSTLAKHSDIVIDIGVKREACPLGLAPTASTTATLAMGDALAVVLLERRHFTTEDFYRFHPAGELGKRLAPKAKDIMCEIGTLSTLRPGLKIKDVLPKLAKNEVLWVTSYKKLLGIINGKVKTQLLMIDPERLKNMSVKDICTKAVTVSPDTSALDVLEIIRKEELEAVAVIDKKGNFIGAVFLKDLLNKVSFSLT